MQRLVKGRPQLAHECQRTAEIDDVALDRTTLCKSGNRLVHHCLEYARRDIALTGPLDEQRLDIRLCEYAAPGGYSIDFLGTGRFGVHLVGRNLEQGGHLVDECPGPSGTRTVHPYFHAMREEEYLGILTTEFDDHIGLGCKFSCSDSGSIDLLDKAGGCNGRPYPYPPNH